MDLSVSVGFSGCCFLVFITLLYGVDEPFSLLHRYFHDNSEILHLAHLKNKGRRTLALDYIHSIKEPIKTLPESNIDILVVIVTVARKFESRSPSRGYLLQTAAAINKLLKTDKHFSRKSMFICNVDESPDNHVDASELKHYMPYVDKHGKNSLGKDISDFLELTQSGLTDQSRQQEIVDYAYCLKASLSIKYDYVLVLEDDVIAHKKLFEVLHNTMKYRLSGHYEESDKHRFFSFLKLYYPQRWMGYAWELVPLIELICIGALGGTMFVIIAYFSTLQASRMQQANQTPLSLVFASGFVVFVSIAVILGRVNVIELRRLSPSLYKLGPSSACCSQAMLYQRNTIPLLLQHLLVNNSMNKDLAIYEFSRKYAIPGYQLEPNLFWHTGMYSSLSNEVNSAAEFLFDFPRS